MRKDRLYFVGSVALFVWISMTYFLFVHRPNAEAVRRKLGLDSVSGGPSGSGGRSRSAGGDPSISAISKRIDTFEKRLKRTMEENGALLQALREAVKESHQKNEIAKKAKEVLRSSDIKYGSNNDEGIGGRKHDQAEHNPLVIAILMFACNRVTVSRALDSLLKYRKDQQKFPIVVSQV